MRRFVPRAIAIIGIAVLWFTAAHLSDSDSHGTLFWTVYGSGFLLAGGGLIATAAQLDRKRRTIMAISLLAFGSTSLVLVMAIAHLAVLPVFAVLALLFGTIVGIMAILQRPSLATHRD